MIDYLLLHGHFHKMVSSGIAINASLNSREKVLSDIGIESSLTYQTFCHACTGYAKMVSSRRRTFFALLVEILLATMCVMGRQMDQHNAK